MVSLGLMFATTDTSMHVNHLRSLWGYGCLALALAGCTVGETDGGGTGGGSEPPNPVVLKQAAVIAGIDAYWSGLAGDSLVAADSPGNGRPGYRQRFKVANGSVMPGDRVDHMGGETSIDPGPVSGSRVFYNGTRIRSVDIASGEEVEFAGTDTHWAIGVVGDALVTEFTGEPRAVFVSDLKAPQTPARKIADGTSQMSGDMLSIQAADSHIDVYRVKSPQDVVKEGSIAANTKLAKPVTIKLGAGGNVFTVRTLPDGKEQAVVYAKDGASFVDWYSTQASGSERVLAASGSLMLLASWAGKPGEGPVTVSVVDIAKKGAPRELTRQMSEDSAAVASKWSGQVAYVYTASRLLAVDARDGNTAKFVDIFSGVRGVTWIQASGSTLAVGIPYHTLVLSMADAPSGSMLHCGTVDAACFSLLAYVPNNTFSNAFFYVPQYPLFSDGALKRRSLLLPPGQKINTSNPDAWVFPKGTSILKEFYSAPATLGAAAAPLEARLWVKTGDAAGPAAWAPTVYTDSSGTWKARNPADAQYLAVGSYQVPHTGVCMMCHQGTNDVVLGFDALQLSGAARQVFVPGKGGTPQPGATLEQLNAVAFTQPVAATAIQGTEKAKAALGYLHSNCGSCHSETGLAAGRGLRFRHVTTAQTPQQEPAYATLIAAPARMIPGNATGSTVFQRATTNMPPRFPTTPQQTQDAVAGTVLGAWINELTP